MHKTVVHKNVPILVSLTAALLLGTASPGLAGDAFPDKPMPNIVAPAVQFGAWGAGPGQFNDPGAIAIDGNNIIYVAECSNNRVQLLDKNGSSVAIWDKASGTKFNCPQGVAVAENGDVFVSERLNIILHLDKTGRLINSFGKSGVGLGKLNDPGRLVVKRGFVYVCDRGNNRISVFTVDGSPVKIIGQVGPENGNFQSPEGVAVDDDGNVYVVDHNNRIQKFNSDGNFVQAWGTYGGMPGQLAEPTDVAVVGDRLFVADTVNHRIQSFDLDGKLRLVWGRHPETAHQGLGHTHYPSSIKVSPDGTFAVVCEPFEFRCQLFDMEKVVAVVQENTNAWWEKFPRFHYGARVEAMTASQMTGLKNSPMLSTLNIKPTDVPRQMLVITEPDLHRIVALSLDAPLNDLVAKAKSTNTTSVELPIMYSLGSFGHEAGKFSSLASISLTKDGRLLAGDAGNNNMQEFNAITGTYNKTLFGSGTAAGEFHGPSGAVEDADGNIYIGDYHNNRIQVFDKNYNFKFRFGELGSEEGKLFGPIDLTLSHDGNEIYVVDQGNHRIQVFDKKGVFQFAFGRETRPGEWGQGTFQSPFAVATSNDGFVYVTDENLQLVEKFDAKGNFISQWGGWGTRPGEFYKPKGVTVDEEGNVYVIDFGNHRGQIFDPKGTFLGTFGEGVLYPAKN